MLESVNVILIHINRNLDAILFVGIRLVHQREDGTAALILIGSIKPTSAIKISLDGKTIRVCKGSLATKTKAANGIVAIVSRTTEIRSIELHTILMIHASAVVTNRKYGRNSSGNMNVKRYANLASLNVRIVGIGREFTNNRENLVRIQTVRKDKECLRRCFDAKLRLFKLTGLLNNVRTSVKFHNC